MVARISVSNLLFYESVPAESPTTTIFDHVWGVRKKEFEASQRTTLLDDNISHRPQWLIISENPSGHTKGRYKSWIRGKIYNGDIIAKLVWRTASIFAMINVTNFLFKTYGNTPISLNNQLF